MVMTKVFGRAFLGFNKNEVILHLDKTMREYNDIVEQKSKEIEELKNKNIELERINEQLRKEIKTFAEDKERIAEVLLKAEAKAEEIINNIYVESDKEKKKLEIEREKERKKMVEIKEKIRNLQGKAIEVVNDFTGKVEAVLEYAEEA